VAQLIDFIDQAGIATAASPKVRSDSACHLYKQSVGYEVA